jgi:hypothetical protein
MAGVMIKFEDLPANARALILAKFAMELRARNTASAHRIARTPQIDVMSLWRSICRKARQPVCTIPAAATRGRIEEDVMDPSQAKIPANPGATRPTRRGQSQRSRNWMIILFLGVAAGLMALAGFALGFFSVRSSAAVTEPASESMPTGTIAESDTPVCKRLTFDDKGQVVRDVVPCDGSVRDARGQPVPIGTIERLNAISKSFSGH